MAVYDETTARALLEKAVALDSKPSLDEASMDLLLHSVAATTNDAGIAVYESAGLNRAASLGWSWKAGMTAEQYELGGGSGKYLKRQQWTEACRAMAEAYRTGTMSVDGATAEAASTKRGLGVITLTTDAGIPTW